MYCTKCGTENDANAWKCVKCGDVLQGCAPSGGQVVAIPNYLAQSILVTLLCCLPIGIPAIVFASQVNAKIQAGDVQGATDASNKAKMWCWLSFGAGLVGGAVYLVVVGIGVAFGA